MPCQDASILFYYWRTDSKEKNVKACCCESLVWRCFEKYLLAETKCLLSARIFLMNGKAGGNTQNAQKNVHFSTERKKWKTGGVHPERHDFLMPLLLKRMKGNFSAWKKSGLLRWSSLWVFPVSISWTFAEIIGAFAERENPLIDHFCARLNPTLNSHTHLDGWLDARLTAW